MPAVEADTPRKMFPPPMTTPISTPSSMTSRISCATCSRILGAMPYFASPISASPLSLSRMRLNRGGVAVASGKFFPVRPGGRGKLTCAPGTVKERPLAEVASVRVVGHWRRAQLGGGERPRRRLEGREGRDLHVELRRGQVAEAARARQDARLERPHRF